MKQKKSTEDYLKTICILAFRDGVRGADLAKALQVSRPTVSVALKALEQEGYVRMGKTHLVYLTERGLAVAKDMYDRHQTFQALLIGLGVDKETAARDACELEHSVSAKSFCAIKRALQTGMETEKNNKSGPNGT